MIKYIYALCEKPGEPFYVGITGDMQKREKDHKYSKKNGTEAKYQHIRKLEEEGKEWEMILLETVDESCTRWEDFWVYSLIMEGYELKNMKAGDSIQAAERDAMLVMRNRGERYNTAGEFLAARDREIAEAKARKAAEKLIARTKRTVSSDIERTLMVGENPNVRFMSPAMQEIIRKRNDKDKKYRQLDGDLYRG